MDWNEAQALATESTQLVERLLKDLPEAVFRACEEHRETSRLASVLAIVIATDRLSHFARRFALEQGVTPEGLASFEALLRADDPGLAIGLSWRKPDGLA